MKLVALIIIMLSFVACGDPDFSISRRLGLYRPDRTWPISLTASPKGDNIFFILNNKDGSCLFRYDGSTNTMHKYQYQQGIVNGYAVSYDESLLAISVSEAGVDKCSKIIIMKRSINNDEYTIYTSLDVPEGLYFSPSFSLDDSYLIYSLSEDSLTANLWMYDFALGQAMQITDRDLFYTHAQYVTDDIVLCWQAKWFGHSSPIAASRWHRWQLCTIGKDNTLLEISTSHYNRPDYVLDRKNKQVIYLYSDEELRYVNFDGNTETIKVYIHDDDIDNDTKRRKPLPGFFSAPSISPCSNYLALAVAGEKELGNRKIDDIYIINLNSNIAKPITNLETNIRETCFSNRGEYIYYSIYRSDCLWRINIDTLEVSQIVPTSVHTILLDELEVKGQNTLGG